MDTVLQRMDGMRRPASDAGYPGVPKIKYGLEAQAGG